MALWSGRFVGGVDAFTQEFGASLEVDKNMYAHDIAGSRAHAKMLAAQGVISAEDAASIDAGLAAVKERMDDGSFVFDVNDEDIHMAVEAALIADIGSAGARLHTGRSRNDQVATDLRLYAKDLLASLMEGNIALRHVLIEKAQAHFGVVMPGYTHLQHAQPVLFSHHMLAYFWMFTRDFARLAAAYDAADANPLGSAAAGGNHLSARPRHDERAAGLRPRDSQFARRRVRPRLPADLEYACSVSMMHLSRLCEEIILWSSSEYSFITLSDAFLLDQGSSIDAGRRRTPTSPS